MRISGVNPYSEIYNINDSEKTAITRSRSQGAGDVAAMENRPGQASGDVLISRSERDFFIKMFPQNSEQLEKHVVFNRQGKIQSNTFGKGTIIDGLA